MRRNQKVLGWPVLGVLSLLPACAGHVAGRTSSAMAAARVGQTVRVAGNADVALIGYDVQHDAPPPNVMERPRAGYDFVEASFKFHNPQAVGIALPLHAFLAASRGRTRYAPMVFLPNARASYGTGSLGPGETGQGYVIYEVRALDRHALLIYRPDPEHPHRQAVWAITGS
jgi:hypothetical protein